jgi:hypothetical protein
MCLIDTSHNFLIVNKQFKSCLSKEKVLKNMNHRIICSFHNRIIFQLGIIFSPLCFFIFFLCLGLKFNEKIVFAGDVFQFEMQTFVGMGSDNLAPEIRKGLEGYQKRGKNMPEFMEVAGIGNIRLESNSQIKFSSAIIPEQLYNVSFNFTFEPGSKFDFKLNYPGLHGWVSVQDEKGETINAWRILEQRNSTSSMHYATSIYSPSIGKNILFRLSFNGTNGHALISDIQIRAAKISADDNHQLIKPPRGKEGKTFIEIRQPVNQPHNKRANIEPLLANPKISEMAEVKNEPIIFHRTDPDKVFFYSLPKEEEIEKRVKLALTPSEVTVFTIAVRPTQNITGLKLDIPDLKDPSGKVFQGTFESSMVRYHPRRIDYYGRGQTWHWVADHLYKASEGISAGPNSTQVFWVKALSFPDSTTGSYTGNIRIRSADGVIGEIPIEVVVRPYTLVEMVGKSRGIYPDLGRWKSFSDAQILKELDDFKSHGINTMLIPSGRPVVKNGEIIGWELDKVEEHHLNLIAKAKMDGPFLVWLGWLDGWLASHFKLSTSDLQKDPSLWPKKMQSAYKKCLVLFKEDFERRGWGNILFHAVDEPGYWKEGSFEQFIWKYEAARKVGLNTYSTSSYLPDDPLGNNLTHHCYGKGVLVNQERTAFVQQKTKEAEQKFWYYGVGTYSGQIGNMVRNRYFSGFMFHRSQAEGLMIWTFQRPKGDPFDDFYASKTGQPCITYNDPHNAGENLDTPQWEGIRQGWIDYRYAATLAELAKTSAAAKADLDMILEKMPWNGNPFIDDAVTNKKCDQWREEIAEAIEKHMGGG